MAVSLTIKVVPKSGRLELKQEKSGVIKCYLKSAPEKGKANKELIRFLAKKLGLTLQDIVIAQGELSRNKVVVFEKIDSIAILYEKLGLEAQANLLL